MKLLPRLLLLFTLAAGALSAAEDKLIAAVRAADDERLAATQAAGLECPDTVAQLKQAIKLVTELRAGIKAVIAAEEHHDGKPERHAKYIREKLVPAMDRARAASDALELVIPDDLWTLPTYAEMLFIR